jgi:hypothetical protein
MLAFFDFLPARLSNGQVEAEAQLFEAKAPADVRQSQVRFITATGAVS